MQHCHGGNASALSPASFRFEVLTGTTITGARGSAPFEERPAGRFGPFAVGAAFVLALATFLVFAGFTPILPTAGVVWTLLIGDGLVVIVLIVLIGLELARLRAARRAARAIDPLAANIANRS